MAFKPLYDQLSHGPFLGSGDHYSPARADLAGLLEAVRNTTYSLVDGHVCRGTLFDMRMVNQSRGDRSASAPRPCLAWWGLAESWCA